MTKTYLGVDESNHGRFPEIYVGVFSGKKMDTHLSEKASIPKLRKTKRDISSYLGQRPYKHIVIPEEFKAEFETHGIQIIVLSEFIQYFEKLSKIIMDGNLDEKVIEYIKKINHPNKIPFIQGVPDGDKKVRLVNIADSVAYQLFRHYTSKFEKDEKTKGIYLKHLLTPKLEDYSRKLERAGFF